MKKYSIMTNRFFMILISGLALFSILFFQGCGDDAPPTDPGSITVTPTELNFGIVRTDQSKSLDIAIENTTRSNTGISLSFEGEDKDAFSIDGETSISVEKDGQATVKVVFSPTEGRQYTASLKVGTAAAIALSGEGSETLKISVSPEALDYGTVKTGVKKSMNLNIENVSSIAVDIELTFDGDVDGAFSLPDGANINVGVGEIKTVAIDFLPTEEKLYQASIKIDTFAVVQLSGTGSNTIDLTISPSSLDFGEVEVGAADTKTIIVQNLSQTAVTLEPTLFGDDFYAFEIVEAPSEELTVGAKGDIKIRFSPSLEKIFIATLSIDAGKNFTVPLKGTGFISADLFIDPVVLNFGAVELGQDESLSVTVENISSAPLTITFDFSGTSFSIDNPPQNAIAAGENEIVEVKFAPIEEKSYKETLKITSSNNQEYEVKLNGRGTAPTDLNLFSEEVYSPPEIDGDAGDAAWNAAGTLYLSLNQIQNPPPPISKTYAATIKSVYDNQYIYFLVEVQDDTRDDSPNRFVFKGGDASDDANWTLETNGQDGVAFIFPISDEVLGDGGTTFDQVGCRAACHTADQITNYESGMYPTRGTIDMWYWKAGTTNPQGFADDFYAMGSDGQFPNQRRGDVAGRTFSDVNFRPEGNIVPISVAGGDNNGLNKNRFIWDPSSNLFDPDGSNPATGAPWAVDDVVPGWKLRLQSNPFSGRGDVEAKGVYKNGTWIIEMKRLLITENDNGDDTIFEQGSEIPFSLAYFDNSRKYANFEYWNLSKLPRPGHCGPSPLSILLKLK